MKLYQSYKNIIDRLMPIEFAWFTTFNLDTELLEKYLLSVIGDKEPGDLKTLEDWETLNLELQEKNIKVWCDYRALNYKSEKRTSIDIFPVDPKGLYKTTKTDSIFHPKVIFIKGVDKGAYLIAGSANLSVAAWSSNCESVSIKKVETIYSANQIIVFFEKIGADVSNLRKWAAKLNKTKPNWDFVYSLEDKGDLLDQFNGLEEELTVWSPYFSKNTSALIEKINRAGCPKINLVPDISEVGKIRITPDELKTIQMNKMATLYRIKNADERLYHAKVWMTPKALAVGSWNFSSRATGIAIAKQERNIEAGIIEAISETQYFELKSGLISGNNRLIGTDKEELEKEWEDILLPFSYCCSIYADWSSFSYHLAEGTITEGYTISLPHDVGKRYSLHEIDGMSFIEQHVRLLTNKSFTVYDKEEKNVYQGYLIEIKKEKRPVYGYLSLLDLFESLAYDPFGETSNKHIKGQRKAEADSDIETRVSFEYSGTESYYMMFVSFQKLYDAIEKAGESDKSKDNRGKGNEMDNIGFRLPGSLINICGLVNESIEKAVIESNEDSMLFHWFLAQEVTRCLLLFKKYSGKQAGHVSSVILENKLNFNKRDIKFISKLKRQFYNVQT